MVITRRHKYVFIETPITGSWAIRNELIEFYGGEPILHKHASYRQFAKVAGDHE